jgi:predicted PurR-regulated permease PerM
MEPSDLQRRIWNNALTALSLLAIGGVVVAAVWLLVQAALFLKPILGPLAFAGVLAFLLEPAVEWLETKGWNRRASISALFALGVGFLVFGAVLVLPRAFDEAQRLAGNADRYWAQMSELYQMWSARIGGQFTAHPEWIGQLRDFLSQQGPKLAGVLGKYMLVGLQNAQALFSFALGLALVPVVLFYLLSERHAIEKSWRTYVPLRREWFKAEIVHVLEEINRYLIAFFRGQVVVAACIGALTGLGLLLIGLDYALLIGAVTGLLSIIPYLGVILSILPAVLIAYLQTQGFLMPAMVAAVFAAVQMLEGFFISPKVIGDRVGLHPLTIIVAMMFWTQLLGGFLGALLAVPLTATVRVLFFRYIAQNQTEQEKERS